MIELDALRTHCNGLFAQLSQTYNLCTPFIERFTWKMETQKPTQKQVKEMLEGRLRQDQYNLVTMSWMSNNSDEKIQAEIIRGRERLIQRSLDYVEKEKTDINMISRIHKEREILAQKSLDYNPLIEECKERIRKFEDYSEKLMATTDTIKSKVWEGGSIVESFNKERKEALSGGDGWGVWTH